MEFYPPESIAKAKRGSSPKRRIGLLFAPPIATLISKRSIAEFALVTMPTSAVFRFGSTFAAIPAFCCLRPRLYPQPRDCAEIWMQKTWPRDKRSGLSVEILSRQV